MAAEPTHASQREKKESPRKRYDLATAIFVVRALDTTAGRAAVFEEIKRKNVGFRVVDALYRWSGRLRLQPLILWAYMLKCFISVGPPFREDAKVVSLENFPNERATIDRVQDLVPERRFDRLAIRRRHAIGKSQLQAAIRMFSVLPRIWSFLRTLARRNSFMPAGRMASALAYYIRFKQMFEDREIDAVIVASNYSPEAVGLAAVAHDAGKTVIYANHASVAVNSPVVSPVYADCALFYGEETANAYKKRSACTAEVGLIGQPGESIPMQWRDEVRKVGIFLTAGTRIDTLARLISDIRRTYSEAEILVRDHPVTLLRNDLSQIVGNDPLVELTIGNPLSDEIATCDMIVCGNSAVALNVVSGGRPVAYLDRLDSLTFDAIGYVNGGLIPCIERWSAEIYNHLKEFYGNPEWLAIMQRYDASYEMDGATVRIEAAEILRKYLDRKKTSFQENR